ncbi:MAG: MmgE/PrpD family protein [Actinobacteria bacterium]|nr:MmgE/PrpD family protein [Actinomycetota bacterium]
MPETTETNPHHGRPRDAETRALAEFAAAIDPARLPAEVVERAAMVIADSLACGVAGSSIAPEIVAPMRRYALTIGGAPQASLLVGGEKVAQPIAALANSTAMHTIDYDDTFMPAIGHFGAVVTGAALAAVERNGGSGADLIAAVVAGFEVGGKVGRSVMPGHYERWHSTGSLGGPAAAAAAARGLGLDAEETDMAIGFAADDTGGTRYCIKVGDFSKSLHAGAAAQKGTQGAMLAAAGAMGPTGLLEHPVGFFWAYSEEREPGRLGPEVEQLGSRWEILEDDLKAHPCILASHCGIEATIGIVSENDLAPEQIERISIVQPFFSENHGLNYEPDSAMAARLSVPFCTAVAAIDRRVGLEQFERGRFLEPEVRALMRRITSTPDRSLNERFPAGTPAIVTIESTGGEVWEREIDVPKGSHLRPFTAAEHHEKLAELFGRSLDPAAVEATMAALARLPELDSVGELTAAMVAEGWSA